MPPRSRRDTRRRTRAGRRSAGSSWCSWRGALDQPLSQAALSPQPALDALHAPVVALVIVAQEVQQPVQGQDSDLGAFGVAGLARLAPRHASGDDDVAEE